MSVNLKHYKALFLISLFFLNLGVSMATQEPTFVLESKKENYEIRKYKSMLVAETKIIAQFDDAGSKAFKILADYIFGNNKTKLKLEMTAPVTQQSPSEKIEMTAPVSQIKTQEGFLVQFTMPEKYTMETIPAPNDPRVELRVLPERKIAVYSYSGSWSESRYEEKLLEFQKELKADGVQVIGEPIFARFNSPFQLWFLRRNEIWLEVIK